MPEKGQDSFAKAFIPGLVLGLVIGAVLGAVVPPFLQTSPGPMRNAGNLTPEQEAAVRSGHEDELESLQGEAGQTLEDADAAAGDAEPPADTPADGATPPDAPPPGP